MALFFLSLSLQYTFFQLKKNTQRLEKIMQKQREQENVFKVNKTSFALKCQVRHCSIVATAAANHSWINCQSA